MELGKAGIWWSGSWSGPDRSPGAAATEMESLGYGTLWSSGGFEPGFPDRFGRLLDATEQLAVASGILSIWHATPEQVADGAAALEVAHPGRFLLGLGTSHTPIVEQLGTEYVHPYARMVHYLDELDALGPAVAADRRVLAALGPRMLTLATERAAGAHPYFVPVEHVARARRLVGPGPLLAPELAVVLEVDRLVARTTAREYAAGYLRLPNYANNLRTLGFDDDDLEAVSAIGWSTLWWPGGTPPPLPTACVLFKMQVPTTCACRWWPTAPRGSPSTPTANSLRRCSAAE